MTPKHIAIVGYDNLTSLDLSGPFEAFSSACIEDSKGNRRACYEVTIAALGAKTFCSVSGLCMTAACHLDTLRHLDTLIIPGGSGMRNSAAGTEPGELDQPARAPHTPYCVGLHRRLRRRAHRAAERAQGHDTLEIRCRPG